MWSVVYLLLPSVAWLLAVLFMDLFELVFGYYTETGAMVFPYLVTLVGVIVYFKLDPCRFYFPILGFFLLCIIAFVQGLTNYDSCMQWEWLFLVSLFYSLPFVVVYVIGFLIRYAIRYSRN
jgi:hypothetical protein